MCTLRMIYTMRTLYDLSVSAYGLVTPCMLSVFSVFDVWVEWKGERMILAAWQQTTYCNIVRFLLFT